MRFVLGILILDVKRYLNKPRQLAGLFYWMKISETGKPSTQYKKIPIVQRSNALKDSRVEPASFSVFRFVEKQANVPL